VSIGRASRGSGYPRAMTDMDADDAPASELSAVPGRAGRCPYLRGGSGDWVASIPSADHRCWAVMPALSLAQEKQRRLCLAPEHLTCATYRAAAEARAGRHPAGNRAARGWGWVRTTPVVDARMSVGATVAAAMGGRLRWQLVPAAVVVVALVAVGLSTLRGGGGALPAPSASSIALASPPTPASPPLPTAEPTIGLPSPTPGATPVPSPTPSPVVTPTPAPSATLTARTTYVVKSGDTLYGIAGKYGVTVNAIKSLNGLVSNTLHIGQKLLIP